MDERHHAQGVGDGRLHVGHAHLEGAEADVRTKLPPPATRACDRAGPCPPAQVVGDRKLTRLNSRHYCAARRPSSAWNNNQSRMRMSYAVIYWKTTMSNTKT